MIITDRDASYGSLLAPQRPSVEVKPDSRVSADQLAALVLLESALTPVTGNQSVNSVQHKNDGHIDISV